MLAVAAVLTAVLVAVSGRYGYHRDELYFLACGRHLAWGYPDQPALVPLIARAMSWLAPGSLVVLRLPSALVSGALVVITGLLAREFGGGRRAQSLAATAIAVGSVTTGAGHLLSTTTFDLPAWALLCWLLVRILRTGSERLWLAAGVVAAIGLNDNDLVAFLIFAVVAGLAITGPRSHFRSAWFYTAGAIALLGWAPYLAWQVAHGWPEIAVSQSIANGGSGSSAPRWLILPEQLALDSVYLAPVWITGLVRLLQDKAMRWCRAVGVAYLVLAVVFIAAGGKPYYLAGMFPVLLGAGAQPTVDWMAGSRGRTRWVAAGLVLSLTVLPVTLPVLPTGVVHDTPIVTLNYDAGETIGWPAFVAEIDAVYRSLPPSMRAHAIVLTSNYGEAGAVERYGPGYHLPPVYSGHNGFWYWGPPPSSATVAVAVGFGYTYVRHDGGLWPTRLVPVCRSLRLVAHLNNHVGVQDTEQGAPVWVCQRSARSWRQLWPGLRNFG